MAPPLLSPLDIAFARYRSLREEILRNDYGPLSEADTRAKLIDPVFREVLGWPESDIRREAPSTKGFADYVLGASQPWLLVEAKRSKPRFELRGSGGARLLEIQGPHFVGNKRLRDAVAQAQSYAATLGAEVAVVTNGPQFVLFRPYLHGKPWERGRAIVWHGWEDIEQNFLEFYQLLSHGAVAAGGLVEAFGHSEAVTAPAYRPLDSVHAPDAELVRNKFWEQIAQVFGPLLTNDPANSSLEREIIEHCYVTTHLSDQADRSLDGLLRDQPPPSLSKANLKAASAAKGSQFAAIFERDVERLNPSVYLLTGGVGSGKTTFLKRFALFSDRTFVTKYCVWLHVDFLRLGSYAPEELDIVIHRYAFDIAHEQLERSYSHLFPQSGAAYEALFADDLRSAELTLLHGLEKGSEEYSRRRATLLHDLARNREQLVTAVLRGLKQRGLRCVVVLDNTDQLGEQFQEKVFLFAQELARQFRAFCIVSLREEKFFAAYRRGIFDAYSDRRFHIGSPDLGRVLEKRLRFGQTALRDLHKEGGLSLTQSEADQLDTLLGFLIRSVSSRNTNIVRMLACVSNGDMRHALNLFKDFVSSGNTNIEKILDILKRQGSYTVPFHEFAKSAILGSRRYYRGSSSRILNVFGKSEVRNSSHLTKPRILARLSSAAGAASSHGEGFVEVQELLREFRESFGHAEDLLAGSSELLRAGLVESEPPRVSSLRDSIAVRSNAAGAYYWRYLVRSFAYIDLVYLDTPIVDKKLASRLASMSTTTDLTVRLDRVRLFLGYLLASEASELMAVRAQDGPFSASILVEIQGQVEEEIKYIKKKVKGLPEDA